MCVVCEVGEERRVVSLSLKYNILKWVSRVQKDIERYDLICAVFVTFKHEAVRQNCIPHFRKNKWKRVFLERGTYAVY